jgi:hypothetical protein
MLMDNSSWTWRNGAGELYRPALIPALWRRVLDLSADAAAARFGPAVERGEALIYWVELHSTLASAASLWSAPDETGLSRYQAAGMVPVPRAAFDLTHYVDRLLRGDKENDVEIEGRLDAAQLDLVFVSTTFRAHLARRALQDARLAISHRRCDQCREWHPAYRATARFCGAKCRNEAHRAGTLTAREVLQEEGL